MGNLWLKIKVGTKVTILALLLLSVLIFLIQNVNKPVTVWLWNDIPTTLLKVLFVTALVSVVLTLLLSTTFRTLRQIKEIRARSRAAKLEAEVRDMRAKAAMLQTKPVAGSTIAAPPAPEDHDAAAASLSDVAPPVDDDRQPPSA